VSVRCLVADDHPALLTALCEFLRANGFDPLEPATNAPDAVASAAEEQPEVAIVDYRMPGLSGAELARRLKEVAPRTRVAVYTAEADAALAREALMAGADALVLKEAPLADVVRALHAALAGRPYVDSAVGVANDPAPDARTCLTERERQVLLELAAGRSHEDIGHRLGIGAETVRTHARKAAARLGARTRTQAVATAIRLGLID
jgi:DNA-binding NarL/FixJ family response regulator